jgi:hypothetical protein
MGDSQRVEESEKPLEMNVSCLIKGAFQKQGIFGAPEKKEIAIFQGPLKLGTELINGLF